MAAGKLNLKIEQGATFSRQLRWQTPLGANVDLSGCTARMQARSDAKSATVLLSLTTGGGLTLGGTAGTIDITLTAAQTAAIPWATAVYDLEVEFPNGTVTRLVRGTIVVSPEVTRG